MFCKLNRDWWSQKYIVSVTRVTCLHNTQKEASVKDSNNKAICHSRSLQIASNAGPRQGLNLLHLRSLGWMGGANQVPTYLGQSLHLDQLPIANDFYVKISSEVSAIVSALAKEVDDLSSDESDTTTESQQQHQQHQQHQVVCASRK